MKKIILNNLFIIIIALFIISLGILYPFSFAAFQADAIASHYAWSKDIYTHHGGYFSWTTAVGYNVFSIIHIFSYLVNSFGYDSPVLYYTFINYFELIFLFVATLLFLKLTNSTRLNLNAWMMALPLGIIVWTFVYLFASPVSFQFPFQSSDNFMIFVDIFILISIGWFLNLIRNIQDSNKINAINISCFFIFSIYFSLTTIRFLSGAIITEAFLLTVIIIQNLKIKKKFCRTELIILTGLMITFIIGYHGFFMIETYSSSSRYLSMGSPTFMHALQNGRLALIQYFLECKNINHFIMRTAYVIVLIYGSKQLFEIFLFKKKSINIVNYTQLFALLALINFGVVTIIGLFSHSIVFYVVVNIPHYYDLSTIFAFLAVMSFIINLLNRIQSVSLMRIMTVCGLSISAIFSTTYIFVKSKNLQLPYSQLLQCIHNIKDLYELRNGMGNFWVANSLKAQENGNIRFNVLAFAPYATNLDYNWLSNLTEKISNNNFLIYTDLEYKQSKLALINSKIPYMNYKEVTCSPNTGIIVFDPKTTAFIDKFRNTEFENAKSWFYITNHGKGQTLWSKTPWHSSFIRAHHEFSYFGSLLNRTSSNIHYQVNHELGMELSGNQSGIVLMSEWISTGKGNYYIKANYLSKNGITNLIVFDGSTGQRIVDKQLSTESNNDTIDFNLKTSKLIAFAISLSSEPSDFTLHEIKLGKFINNSNHNAL